MAQDIEKVSSMSMDIEKADLEKFKSVFPQCFVEGKLDISKLLALFGQYDDNDFEKYKFEWKGKSECYRIAGKRSTGTLRPCPKESVDFENTKNMYIEGDNLEVLKLLQSSYYNKIKMIYIDPPYNTGNDFVYEDDFKDPMAKYKEITEQTTKSNPETMGRFHTNWLNMMYPRLRLAANLLRDDGVIFISIDDNEVTNLRKLCDEVFGEENFIGCAGRISKKASNQGDYWCNNFDYLLTYCKNRDACSPFFGGINYKSYNLIEEEGERKGEKYQLIRLYMTSLDPMRGCSNQRYFIECPDGSFVIPPGENFPNELKDGASLAPQSSKDKVWRWSLNTYLENKDKIVVKKVTSSNLVNSDGNETKWNVYTKTYLNDVIEKSTAKPNNFIENHINQSASHELKSIGIPFDFAKPSSLIKFLAETCYVAKDDIILDFFSGSATTAHAVMQLNAEDGGNRQFICVQLPELCDEKTEAYKAGYKNICEIGKERIRRAGTKLKESEKLRVQSEAQLSLTDNNSTPQTPPSLDTGFKVFKLDTSNLTEWDSTPTQDEQTIDQRFALLNETIKSDRSDLDVVFEVMLKMGIPLDYKVIQAQINDKKAYSISGGGGVIASCLCA